MIANAKASSTFASHRREIVHLVKGIKVDEIVDIFERLGYECKVDSELDGRSGAKHPFDIIARRDSEIIVIDIVSFRASILDTPASDAEVSEQLQVAGIKIRAKGWDCEAYQRFIIYLSSYFSSGEVCNTSQYDPFELFLKQNDIKIVKSVDVRGAAEKLHAMLNAVEPNYSANSC